MLERVLESIEMDLLTPVCTVHSQEDIDVHHEQFHQPLILDKEEPPETQTPPQPWQQQEPNMMLSPWASVTLDDPPLCCQRKAIEIEMEIIQPVTRLESELVRVKPEHPLSSTVSRHTGVRWRTLPERKGLLVKDVVCIPKAQYQQQQDRHGIPRGQERATLIAMGMTSRVTIDYRWSANQMESRLAALFKGLLLNQPRQRFSFTYLQCHQGSMLLMEPKPPAEGWTGEQVIKICGHGPLYILSHNDYDQMP